MKELMMQNEYVYVVLKLLALIGSVTLIGVIGVLGLEIFYRRIR